MEQLRDGFGWVLDERVFTDDVWRSVFRKEMNERQRVRQSHRVNVCCGLQLCDLRIDGRRLKEVGGGGNGNRGAIAGAKTRRLEISVTPYSVPTGTCITSDVSYL